MQEIEELRKSLPQIVLTLKAVLPLATLPGDFSDNYHHHDSAFVPTACVANNVDNKVLIICLFIPYRLKNCRN